VDQGLDACPGWGEIKTIARAYPIELEEDQLSPGQQAVMVMWRISSVDTEGQSTAPDPQEASADMISTILQEFKDILVDKVLRGGELDVDTISSVFEMA
jgi:hypothetical protein